MFGTGEGRGNGRWGENGRGVDCREGYGRDGKGGREEGALHASPPMVTA